MKKIAISLCILIGSISAFSQSDHAIGTPDQVIFAFGGDINRAFVKYAAELSRKVNPKICYLPTASADNANNIIYWYDICHDLPVEPHVLNVWVSSWSDRHSFEEILMEMDVLVVGGGNTLNMIAIWKAQGIDTLLQKALGKGIILAGGSAGSLCWFENGISDSRPKSLSPVNGLAFLKYSHCPHYSSTEIRRTMYRTAILNRTLKPGFACDDLAGVLFINSSFVKSVSLNDKNHSYFISVKDGAIVEEKFLSEIIR